MMGLASALLGSCRDGMSATPSCPRHSPRVPNALYRPRPDSQPRSRASVRVTVSPKRGAQSAWQARLPIGGRGGKAGQRVGDWRIQRVSSVRERRPVFVKMFRRWLSTVRSDSTSLLATSLFECLRDQLSDFALSRGQRIRSLSPAASCVSRNSASRSTLGISRRRAPAAAVRASSLERVRLPVA
jgi:hypothetical protein